MHREVVHDDLTAYIVVLVMVALMIYGKMQMFKDDGNHTSNEPKNDDNLNSDNINNSEDNSNKN
jgi:hypothetical protein